MPSVATKPSRCSSTGSFISSVNMGIFTSRYLHCRYSDRYYRAANGIGGMLKNSLRALRRMPLSGASPAI
jgi:hypothetical protein